MTVGAATPAAVGAAKAGQADDDLAWEDTRARAGARAPVLAPSAAPVLRADGIEGPLDWILEQARAGRVDLARVPVADLVGQCVAAVDAALAAGSARAGATGSARPPLERLADWVVMASWLAWLRSGLLLPQGDPEAQAVRDEAEALRRRLASRERVRAMAALLEGRPQLGQDVFARGTRPEARQDLPALLRAYGRLLGPPPAPAAAEKTSYRIRPPLLWPLAAALARMARLLPEILVAAGEDERASLWRFLPPAGSLDAALAAAPPGVPAERTVFYRSAIAGTLLAGLELARRGAVALEQVEVFGGITVRVAGQDASAE